MPWAWANGLQISHVPDTWTFSSTAAMDFDTAGPGTRRSSSCNYWSQLGFSAGGFRFGEAEHPGPGGPPDGSTLGSPDSLDFQRLRVGCSNPCGLRGKELAVISLGPGIWTFAETHLTLVTQASVTSTLASYGRLQNRSIRSLFGAPVSFRTNSISAGTWSGVGAISDFPSQELSVPWPDGERDAGRVMLSRHFVGPTPFTVASIYGFPAGPTWPRNRSLTEQLLTTVTKEVVLGTSGCRIIQGDFNQPADGLDAFQIWRHYGWVEAQCLAKDLWGRHIEATCKNASTVDLMWLSPEAAMLCVQVGTMDVFADHLTVYADFHLPLRAMTITRWPLPSIIDWTQVDMDRWQHTCAADHGPRFAGGDPDAFLAQWAHHWESTLHGAIQDQPDGRLPSRCAGRAQRTKPCRSPLLPPTAKPSRQGEVYLHNNLVSMAVHKWFKQLRRLQSYKHAAIANKQTLDAECYRLHLWQAIKRASGFSSTFAQWWNNRHHKTPAAPSQLPLAPPSGLVADAIFLDFKLNFERFERWHCRQKGKLLQAKYDQTCKALFRDLRDPGRGQLDFLWDTTCFAVLDFSLESKQIHLDHPCTSGSSCRWFLNGTQLQVLDADGDLLTLESIPDTLEVGDELQQVRFFTSLGEIHQAMLELWRPRWQKASQIGTADWNRILGFIQAFMPTLQFPDPPLAISAWKTMLRRFPPRAARGVDGIAVADLAHLPDSITQNLLDFLGQIDGSACKWPSQLLFGKVLGLAKQEHSHLPAHYRPVVILSCVYRAWSRMKAQPILQFLANAVPLEAQGFLPGRECAHIWLRLQSYIELCIQQRMDFCGFSADLEKCFNNISRDVLFTLAAHVGLPPALLQPWRSHLDTFERAFEIRTSLSPTVTSTQGLPEGCSLSVVGMVLVDWAYHIYMRLLTPTVHMFSYVDNLTAGGSQALAVVSAFFSTICFFNFWGLSLDMDKSYVWGLQASSRAILHHLGLAVKQDAMELGGNLCFGRARRNRLMKSRMFSLDKKWARLKRSRAPLYQKILVLPASFWAAALHGAVICPLPDGHLHALRKAAHRALHLNQAGANALLRFSLQPNMMADPGFYYVVMVMSTFQRVCRRSASLLDLWRWWTQSFAGDLQQGPFSVLMQTLNSVGWAVLDPPLVQDHLGDVHDFMLLDGSLMRKLLQDAWLLRVSQQVRHRPTMQQLTGIDRYITVESNGGLTAHQTSLQSALQSGAFIDSWVHSKYDMTKHGHCQLCGCPNTHSHLLVCPKYSSLRAKFSLTSADLLSWPQCFSLHLLCPRSPFVDDLRAYFLQLPDTTALFESIPTGEEMEHLFTDGSRFADGRWEIHCASWAVFNANSQQAVATGWVPGLAQTIGRGELMALVAALRWALRYAVRTHIWMDAKFVHEGYEQRRHGFVGDLSDTHADLWLQVEQMIAEGVGTLASSSWIPSHLDPSRCENPFEDWVATNNGKVDLLAVRQNLARPVSFWNLVMRQNQWDQLWRERLHQLRQYYFGIFELTHGPNAMNEITVIESSDDDESESRLYSFADILAGLPNLCTFDSATGLPFSFLESIIHWINSHDDVDSPAVAVSLLEITVGLLRIGPITFPHRNPTSGKWHMRDRLTLYERPTLAFYIGLVQKVFQFLARQSRHFDFILQSLDCSSMGVHVPQRGVALRLNTQLRADIKQVLAFFTASRPIRRAADMARPLC